MAEAKQTTVRVLVGGRIDGFGVESNEVVKYDTTALKPYVDNGMVDKTKAAVEYAIEAGAEVRELIKPELDDKDDDSETDD